MHSSWYFDVTFIEANLGCMWHPGPRSPTAFELIARIQAAVLGCTSRQNPTIAYMAFRGTSRLRAANVDVVNCKSSWQTNGKCVWGQKTQPLTKMSGCSPAAAWCLLARLFFFFSQAENNCRCALNSFQCDFRQTSSRTFTSALCSACPYGTATIRSLVSNNKGNTLAKYI